MKLCQPQGSRPPAREIGPVLFYHSVGIHPWGCNPEPLILNLKPSSLQNVDHGILDSESGLVPLS